MPNQAGEKTATEVDNEFRSWAAVQPTVGGCLHCPDFRPTGTATEVRIEFQDHLATFHPELIGRRRRKRGRANPAIIAFRQSLTDDEIREIDAERSKRMKLLGIRG